MTRRDVLAVGLQVLGSAAALLTVMLVTRRFGLEAQGRFGMLKSWMDAFVAIALLGLPQALLHMAYHGDQAVGRLLAYAQRHAAIALALALALAALATASPAPWLAWSLLAVPGLVLHGLLRSLLLKAAGPLAYAVATAMPALALLALVVALVVWQTAWQTAWQASTPAAADPALGLGPALLLAGLVSALGALWMLRRAGLRREPLAGLRMPAAIHLHASLQNASAAAQAALLLAWLGWQGQAAAAIGEASLALVVLQLCAVAAAYLAPLIYDRAARGMVAGQGKAWIAAGAVTVAIPIALWLLPLALAVTLPGYSAALRLACQLMTVAGVLLLGNRLAATLLQARGAFSALTGLALLRLIASLVLLAVLLALGQPAAPALAGAVLLSEALVAGATLLTLRAGMARS